MEAKIKEISMSLNVDNETLLMAYKQIKARGFVSSEDMSRVICTGLPGFTILSKILNVTKSESHSMCSDRKVTIENFEQMLEFYHKELIIS